MASVMKNAFQVCRALTKSINYGRTMPMLSVNARLMSSGKISDARKCNFLDRGCCKWVACEAWGSVSFLGGVRAIVYMGPATFLVRFHYTYLSFYQD